MTQPAARKLKEPRYDFHEETERMMKRKPGRPPSPDGPSLHVQIAVTKLRRWLAMVAANNEQPRSARSRQAMRDLAVEISEKLGPAAAPDWKPKTGDALARAPWQWRVTSTEGWEKTFTSAREAAAAMDLAVATLYVYLGRAKDGKNRTVKKRRDYSGPEPQTYILTCVKERQPVPEKAKGGFAE